MSIIFALLLIGIPLGVLVYEVMANPFASEGGFLGRKMTGSTSFGGAAPGATASKGDQAPV